MNAEPGLDPATADLSFLPDRDLGGTRRLVSVVDWEDAAVGDPLAVERAW